MIMPTRHQPSGLPGLRQATTKPTTPKGADSHHSPPPVLGGHAQVGQASGRPGQRDEGQHDAQASSTVTCEASLS